MRWVVTEYGTAYLFGKSLAERALALIAIAHPDDRPALLAAAQERGIVAAGQQLRSHTAYPVDEERELALRDGRTVLLRPTRAVDRLALQELFHRMPEKDVQTRFFQKLSSLTDDAADHLCNVDYHDEMAFAAVVGRAEHERIVATSSYYLDPRDGLAEVAYMVEPGWQGSGLATALHARTVEYARSHGVRGFSADVLMNNLGDDEGLPAEAGARPGHASSRTASTRCGCCSRTRRTRGGRSERGDIDGAVRRPRRGGARRAARRSCGRVSWPPARCSAGPATAATACTSSSAACCRCSTASPRRSSAANASAMSSARSRC